MEPHLPSNMHRRDEGEPTLRITILDVHKGVVMKLEGKIVGAWVAECRQSWEGLQSGLGSRKLSLDICGVSFVDGQGVALLQEIHAAADASFIADSPLTRHFAQLGTREMARNGN